MTCAKFYSEISKSSLTAEKIDLQFPSKHHICTSFFSKESQSQKRKPQYKLLSSKRNTFTSFKTYEKSDLVMHVPSKTACLRL